MYLNAVGLAGVIDKDMRKITTRVLVPRPDQKLLSIEINPITADFLLNIILILRRCHGLRSPSGIVTHHH